MESIFTKKLGLFGWDRLEPILLGALINEVPLLLIGKHGTAKSYLLERLSKAMQMKYKFYNASLIDYDDLVGIPVPNQNRTALKYIQSETSIWGAEVVFIDEINRTKPELQNKLFPIIYEKRVQGVELNKLKYRWAAMNPCVADDDINYLGTMPLDEALADRFGFLIKVPEFDDLQDEDKLNILVEQYKEEDFLDINLPKLVKEGKRIYEELKTTVPEDLDRVVIDLVKLLKKKFGYLSARRATILKDSILATHAARLILNSYQENKEEITLKDTLYLVVPNALPNIANENISLETIYRIIKTVVDSYSLEDEARAYMLNTKPIDRLIYGFKNMDKISHKVIYESLPTLVKDLDDLDRYITSYALTLKFKELNDVPAFIVETFFNFSNYAYTCNTRIRRPTRRNEGIINLNALNKAFNLQNDDKFNHHLRNLIAGWCEESDKESFIMNVRDTFYKLYKGLEING